MIKKILIATGGTGGHVFPAYSLANSLKEDYNVILTTDKRGLNYLKNYKNIAFKIIHSSPNKKNIFKLFIVFNNYFFFYYKVSCLFNFK